MNFSNEIKQAVVKKGSINLYWIGQAGFAIKTHNGKIILIDPYLTDSVHKLLKEDYGMGFKRLAPALFKPDEIKPDFLLISHEHGDHLDCEAVVDMCDKNKTVCICNEPSKNEMEKLNVRAEKILAFNVGDKFSDLEFTVTAMFADHSEICPQALGFMIDFEFIRIYYSGDTCFNMQLAEKVMEYRPEIALLPINGAFGNLDGIQAAKFANYIGAKICVPHHFWTFPMHLGNPLEAEKAFGSADIHCELKLLTPGELFEISG